jgi:hypothetical protein
MFFVLAHPVRGQQYQQSQQQQQQQQQPQQQTGRSINEQMYPPSYNCYGYYPGQAPWR